MKQDYHNIEIIIVDNASPDKIGEFIKKKFRGIKVIIRHVNDGLGSALNAGVNKSTGKYVMVGNEDMELAPKYVSELVGIMETNPAIGCTQGLVYDYYDRNRIQSCGVMFSITGRLKSAENIHPEIYANNGIFIKKSDIKSYPVFSVKGPAFLIRKDVFEKIGGFDADYFLYFEEVDLCWRINLAGYRVKVTPKCKLFHVGAGSTTGSAYEFFYMHSLKNQLTTYAKNSPPLKLLVSLIIQLFISLGSIIIFLARGNIRLAFANAAGWFEFVKNIGKTIGKRRKILRVHNQPEFIANLLDFMRP
ncbi:MAG: glycosyltransferase family 2 protein [Patescibacteria group bacterium]